MNKRKYALISLFDKTNLTLLCKILNKHNIRIISTGATSKEIKKLGFECKSVSTLTKFPEILNGRVKTLHPKIHSSLLYKRKNKSHAQTFKKLNFPKIDFLIVNLYPFEKAIKNNINYDECLEMIDIGGPALLRSAAKNFESLTAICNIKDYPKFINNLEKNNGETTILFRKKMAQKIFYQTSLYDKEISNWFLKQNNKSYKSNKIKLRYGENPHQNSIFIKNKTKNFFSNKIQGKDLSYNNILDLDSGLKCIQDFNEPTCVIIKHNNPCGVASDKTIYSAFVKALKSDRTSSFGGIVLLNRSVDKKLAKKISQNYFEIIAAKKFNTDSINILNIKKNLIIIKTNNLTSSYKEETRSVFGGQLIQNRNITKINLKNITCMSKIKAKKNEISDLIFALKVAKHVKSNSIVLAKNKQTIGIGAGQMSRIDAVMIAILKNNDKKNNFVAASDAFFPFTDGLKILIKNNCKSIIQPGGSINDRKIINLANNHKISVYFSKFRHFKH